MIFHFEDSRIAEILDSAIARHRQNPTDKTSTAAKAAIVGMFQFQLSAVLRGESPELVAQIKRTFTLLLVALIPELTGESVSDKAFQQNYFSTLDAFVRDVQDLERG